MPTDPNQRSTTVKNQSTTEVSFDWWKNSENKLKIFKIILETKKMTPIPLTRIATSTILTRTTKTVTEPKESQKLLTHPPCETRGKTNPSTEKSYHGANAANRPPPRQRRPERRNQVQERANRNDSNETTQAAQKLNWKFHVFTPGLWLTDRK